MKLSERKFYDFIQESSDPSDVYTVTLTQNMEVTDANHWKVELLLERWRTRKQLVAYLRTVADMVEGCPSTRRTPTHGLLPRSVRLNP
jgi:hypothetical protein